ncbi:enoyl-CoA hydratase [Herbaspirillum rubrisubalbicans]|uniref:Enoyl-CoA hydratase domain-containing protein 3, mitochondrial n=1 Tax=Herbaspirillum rubrisubalbicans Os34 TaxID=1235827 RepID=A0A6M3ZXX3_9BURK|nr:enoyl-CoA hydratase [Herbaspirillum rubrisubalbicans]QJQ02760.1 enoyl-CoA hydratase [Herbaspirillum rubrisubalbicans Os34]
MQASSPQLLLRHDQRGITTLTLNRPQQFNALSDAMLQALQTQLDALAHDDQVRCVILAANGRAFCAGHDLREMHATPEQAYYQQLFERCSQLMQSLRALPVPVIAKVQGLATAAGCQLVASCDLAVAADSARFAVSGINVGLFCSTPAVALTRNLPIKRAFEMLVTGKFIDAATAADWGLINQAVPETQLDAATEALAREICSKPAISMARGKALVYQQQMMALPDAYAHAAEVMACNIMDDEAMEGIAAFLEKRAPQWPSTQA